MAAKIKQLSKFFDFVSKDGSTFRAIGDHTSRFQVELAQEEDHVEGDVDTRVLSLKNPVVSKVYNGLPFLRKIFTTKVYAIKCVDTGEVIRPIYHQPWPPKVHDRVNPWSFFPRGGRTPSQSLAAHSTIKLYIAIISRLQPTPTLKPEVNPSHTP